MDLDPDDARIVDAINLDGIRGALDNLDAGDRWVLAETWLRVANEVPGTTGWLKHFADQRIGELAGARFVEPGPIWVMSPLEVAGTGEFCRALAHRGTPAQRRYWDELDILFSERLLRPNDRLPLVVEPADSFTGAATAQHPPQGRQEPPADRPDHP